MLFRIIIVAFFKWSDVCEIKDSLKNKKIEFYDANKYFFVNNAYSNALVLILKTTFIMRKNVHACKKLMYRFKGFMYCVLNTFQVFGC